MAEDLRHDRKVAVKVMRPEVSAELAADRFLLEVRTSAKLQHPHIVPVFDSGKVGNDLFFVMPLIEGESLRARLDREGQLPVKDAVQIVTEIAGALEYAHAQGILHRDLKPENIMLSRGHALLADFGIARTIGSPGRERLTQTGMSLGTPAYMSPEQASGEIDTGPPSDVYSLATILYETLTGTPPFTGATYEAILVKRFTEDAPRCASKRTDTPAWCDAAVAKALDRDPAKRTASARAFASALTPVATSARTRHSIAVLPFANLSTDPENGYFADGLTEEIISTLSKVRSLQVISRTSVMQYRTRTGSLRDIARELDVTHLLEGSVRKGGDRLRVSASLVAAEHDTSIWSERFDGTLSDVFDMQDRTAAAIVDALSLTLSAEEQTRVSEHPIVNPEAYDRYLRARHEINRLDATGIQNAFDHMEYALKIAPGNPVLLRGMGVTCFAAVNLGLRPDRDELIARGLRYADAIETVSPGSPFVSEIRGLMSLFIGRPLDAHRELGIAFDALPEDPEIPVWYAVTCGFANRPDVECVVGRSVLQSSPGHPLAAATVALGEMAQGRCDHAIEAVSTISDAASKSFSCLLRGLAYLVVDDRERAFTAFDAARANPGDVFTAMADFLANACKKDDSKAREVLTPEVVDSVWADFQYCEFMAEGFLMLDDIAQASRWLDHGVATGFGAYDFVTRHHALWNPVLDRPEMLPVIERLRTRAAEYAEIPVSPRALALLEAGRR